MLTILYGVRTVQLTRGMNALIDEADWPLVCGVSWNASYVTNCVTPYAMGRREGRSILLHRVIVGCPVGEVVDHKNMDTLDNRRENLRVCSRADNNRNSRHIRGESKYKGVSKARVLKTGITRWRAQIRVDRRKITIGYYATEEDAARAYDAAALKYHGEFARTNQMLFGDF